MRTKTKLEMAGWSCQGNNEYLCVFLRCPAATLWLYMLFTVFHGANSSSATVSQTRRWNMTHSVSFVPAFRRLSRNVRGCVNKKCRDSTAHIFARKHVCQPGISGNSVENVAIISRRGRERTRRGRRRATRGRQRARRGRQRGILG